MGLRRSKSARRLQFQPDRRTRVDLVFGGKILEFPLNLRVDLVAMIVVIRHRGVNLGQGEVGVMSPQVLWPKPASQIIQAPVPIKSPRTGK